MRPSKEFELASAIAEYYDNPLEGILFLYDWNKGPLLGFHGPNKHQERFLIDLGDEIRARKFDGMNAVRPIRMSISSGHGTGKTALIGMLAGWLMSTRDALKGTVTANTGQQLATKTWASIQTWHKLLVNKHWFETTSERFFRLGRKSDWFMTPQSCAEENSEAFAGQHNIKSTSVYINDEDSNVPDKIHEVEEGGLTDGESMQFLFGNPTRRSGSFFDINFGQKRDFWLRSTLGRLGAGCRVWNSEESEITNKQQLQEWAEEYGRNSDFYRVRVLGQPPAQGDAQFISADLVAASQRRMAQALSDDPLVAGVDLSWGGDDKNCVRFRRGTDAKTVPPIYVPGEQSRNPDVMTVKLAEILDREFDCGAGRRRKVEMLFMDSAGICGPVARRLRELGHKNIIEVNFGGHSPDPKYENARAFMWGMMRDALPQLAIDRSVELEADLQAPGYKLTKDTKILLEPKQEIIKRLKHSTDDGDALALTFFAPVKSKQAREEKKRKRLMQQQGQLTAWS